MPISPILFSDFYKTDHRRQYPSGTELVYSNLTPRSSRIEGVDKVVVFGLQYFIKEYLIKRFNEDFFNQPKYDVIDAYRRIMDNSLGKNAFPLDHLEVLHDLGYLPIQIKALPEGSLCPLRVPILTVKNTHSEFFWLTNFIETILSNTVWTPITSATIAFEYRKLLERYAFDTSDQQEFVKWMGHDFSMRGMSSLESAIISGGAHLTSFTGTDTIPAITWLEEYYQADCDEELIGGSVSATEHSVMTMGGEKGEKEIITRLLTEVYPTGIVSIVMDSYDYFQNINTTLREMKGLVLSREGKVVVRPDSGDPVKIICGDPDSTDELERKGTIQILWDIFGGTINSKGFKQLDPHIGCIYGDSITLERCEDICKRLKENGFASTNMVFGIGSYTYQHVTRDVFGLAFKATAAKINGEWVSVYKDPKTDSGLKKSAKGLLAVWPIMNEDGSLGDYKLLQEVSEEEEGSGCLQTVFKDGKLVKEYSLSEIRGRLERNLV